jgi:hypothetical protein
MSITSDDFYVIENGAGGGLVMVPRKRLQAALDRHYERLATEDRAKPMKVHRGIMTKDAMPPMNNLGRNGTASPDFDERKRLRFRGKDQTSSPGTSQGSQGRLTGSPQRRPPDRADTPPSLRGGTFTTSSLDEDEINIPSEFNGNGRPSADQDPDQYGLGEVIATLDPAPPGYRYSFETDPSGVVSIICVPDTGEDMSTHDRTFRHKLLDRDPLLSRMNQVNRGYHRRVRDDVGAAQIKRTIFHHTPAPGERMELQRDPENGSVDVVIFSPTTPDMNGPPQPGTQQFRITNPPEPTLFWASATGAGEDDIHELQDRVTVGDRRMPSSANLLAKMNIDNHRFWRGQR